jgi:hypothetical protein
VGALERRNPAATGFDALFSATCRAPLHRPTLAAQQTGAGRCHRRFEQIDVARASICRPVTIRAPTTIE